MKGEGGKRTTCCQDALLKGQQLVCVFKQASNGIDRTVMRTNGEREKTQDC